MKQGWEIKKLGEVCKISPPKSEIKAMNLKDETLVSFLPMEDLGINQMYIRPHNSRSLSEVSGGYTYFAENDILLAKVTPCFENGKLGIAKDLCSNIGFGSSEYIVIRADESNVKSEYIYYGLMTDAFRKNGARLMLGASGLKRLPKDYVANYELGIPSELSEQERIVGILDSAFAKIEALRANAQRNLQNTKDLFQASIENEFRIKSGWTNAQLNSVADVISGYAFKSGDFVDKGMFQVIRIGNVKQDFLRLTESPIFIDSLNQSILCKSLLQQGDLVITQTGTKKKRDYGFVALVNRENLLLNQRVACVRFKDKEINPRYFLYYSYTEKYKNDFFAQEGGAVGQGNVGLTTIKELNVPFPTSKEEQQSIVKKLDALSERCRAMEENYRQTIAHCNALKQALLTKAFNGEL